jgi:hypothetical protein
VIFLKRGPLNRQIYAFCHALQATLPGIGVFYHTHGTAVDTVPPVLHHFIRNVEAVHQAWHSHSYTSDLCCNDTFARPFCPLHPNITMRSNSSVQ